MTKFIKIGYSKNEEILHIDTEKMSYVYASTIRVRIKSALKKHRHTIVLSFKLDLILAHIGLGK